MRSIDLAQFVGQSSETADANVDAGQALCAKPDFWPSGQKNAISGRLAAQVAPIDRFSSHRCSWVNAGWSAGLSDQT
jgi:hypothetical protein